MTDSNGQSQIPRGVDLQTPSGWDRLFKDARDIVLVIRLDGRIVEANDAAVAAYGYDRDRLLSMTIYDLRDPSTLASVRRQMGLANEEGVLFETVHRRKDGSAFFVEVSSRGVLLGSEKVLLSVIRDITRRKDSEEALRKSEAKVRALLDAIPDMIFILDKDGTFLDYKAAKDFPPHVSPAEFLGKKVYDSMPAALAEQFLHYIERALKTGDIQLFEYELPLGGEIRFREARLTGFGEDRVLAIVRDITGIRRVKEALLRRGRQMEILSAASQRLNTVLDVPVILRTLVASAIELVGARGGAAGALEAGNLVFTEYNDNGKIVPIHYVFAPGRGVPGIVMETKEPYIANDTERDPHVIPEIRKALGFFNLVNVPILSRKSDLIGCLEIHNTADRRPFVDQDVVMLKGLAAGAAIALENAQFLAERERTTNELLRLATAVEQSAEMIVITDVDGTIRYVNPAFERTTGYGRDEVLGQTPRLLKSGKQNEAFYRNLWETLGRGDVWSGTFINRRKDGSFYEEDAVISPVRDASGHMVNFVAVKRDVTYERQIEEQLRHSQKMEAVGRLAGGVAHDFNNLLTAITGYSDLLLMRVEDGEPNRRSVEEIRKAAERAAALTRQLLAFSRRQVLQPRVLDLNAVVANMGRMLRRLIGEDVELITSLGGELGRVTADPGQIEQVIVNLVVNARDAMPRGGKLIIETGNVELDAAYAGSHAPAKPGHYVMLAVSDSGCGMDKATMARLFEPFFTTKELGIGTGLGLATVYGIVKQSGGYIWAYSEPGRGSTFKIYLPRVSALAEAEKPREAAHERLAAGSETILVAEDEEVLRVMVSEILRQNGYTVLEASDGVEALQVCQKHKGPIHLLLTDVVMPRMDGLELVWRLGSSRPATRVLYMSGYTDNAIVHHGVLGHGAEFLPKPFSFNMLVAKVRQVLEASR